MTGTTGGTPEHTTRTARFRSTIGRIARGVVAPLEWAAFWIAALYPVVAVPLYVVLQSATFDLAVVAGVAVVNALSLVIGHDHDPGLLGSGGSR